METMEFKKLIELGEKTFISPEYAQTRLHKGNGDQAFVARIVGTDQKYEYKRQFVKRDWSLALGKMKSGALGFPVIEHGLYEFRLFCVNENLSQWHRNGFFVVTEKGVAEVDSRTVSKLALKLNTQEWEEIESSFDSEEGPNEPTVVPEDAEEDSQAEPI
jgi:hypothetical protein